MKAKLLFVTLIITTCLFTSVSSTNNLIRQVVANIQEQSKDLQLEIEESPETQTTAVTRVIGVGFSKFQQNADVTEYKGVSDDALLGFAGYLKSTLSIPVVFEASFEEDIMLIQFSSFNEVVVHRIIYSTGDTKGSCRYVCLLAQRNQWTKETDFLVADIKAEFELAPDLFVIDSSVSNAWGLFKDHHQNIIKMSKAITPEQVTVIIKFFEIMVFERFAVILKLGESDHHKVLKFLE
jgi:hypothetical protein